MKKVIIITAILCICIIAGGVFFLSGKNNEGMVRMKSVNEKVGLSFASMMVKKSKRKLKNLPPEMKLLPDVFAAVEASDVAKLASLLSEGAPANRVENATSDTPLFIAIKNNNARMVQLLLTYNANPFQVTENGHLPIHMALHPDTKGDTEDDLKTFEPIVKALREKGVSVNQRNLWGETPLMLACRGDKKHLAEYLILNGADIDLKMPDGKTLHDIGMEAKTYWCTWFYENKHLFEHHKEAGA